MNPTESHRRRRLPHHDVPGAAYFVTTCLDGSIPALGLADIRRQRSDDAARPRPAGVSDREWAAEAWKRAFGTTDRWLDDSPARRDLEAPALAGEVAAALRYFAGQRYDLLAFVVMPSHFHWVFRPLESWAAGLSDESPSARAQIVHSVNRHSALTCNRLLQRSGPFWQRESYDHWVRDADELERIIRYVEHNPVKAGLATTVEAWPFSSAHDRQRLGLALGTPLIGQEARDGELA